MCVLLIQYSHFPSYMYAPPIDVILYVHCFPLHLYLYRPGAGWCVRTRLLGGTAAPGGGEKVLVHPTSHQRCRAGESRLYCTRRPLAPLPRRHSLLCNSHAPLRQVIKNMLVGRVGRQVVIVQARRLDLEVREERAPHTPDAREVVL
jgi:hypothetical protein